jgi:hypothetical protein
MKREDVEKIVAEHYGILSRTAKKIKKTPGYVRQVIVLRITPGDKVWDAFEECLKEMRSEKKKSEATKVSRFKRIHQQATA